EGGLLERGRGHLLPWGEAAGVTSHARLVGERGAELLVRGTVGDAPGTNAVVEVLVGVNRARVDVAARLAAAGAFHGRRRDAAGRERIGMIFDGRKVHARCSQARDQMSQASERAPPL